MSPNNAAMEVLLYTYTWEASHYVVLDFGNLWVWVIHTHRFPKLNDG